MLSRLERWLAWTAVPCLIAQGQGAPSSHASCSCPCQLAVAQPVCTCASSVHIWAHKQGVQAGGRPGVARGLFPRPGRADAARLPLGAAAGPAARAGGSPLLTRACRRAALACSGPAVEASYPDCTLPAGPSKQILHDIEDAHDRAVQAGSASYQDPATGYSVITEPFLRSQVRTAGCCSSPFSRQAQTHVLMQGICCGNRCRHCPYGWVVGLQRGQPVSRC